MTITERDHEIVRLTKQGLSARKIKERLRLTISSRQVNRIAYKYMGSSRTGSKSTADAIHIYFMPYVKQCLEWLGKDPHWCEVCEERQEKPCIVHHTKYENATIYDLVYACSSCNNSRENRGLN